jgi:predicted amidohydrolase
MSEIILKAPSFFAGFLQFDVQSGAIEKNLSRVREGLAEIAESHKQISPGIIVLPELWATGFAYAELPALVGTIPVVLESLQELSAKYQVSIAGSLPEYTDNKYYNTLFITGPAGTFGTYRKQRLFSPMAEDTFFSPGTDPNPIQTTVAAANGPRGQPPRGSGPMAGCKDQSVAHPGPVPRHRKPDVYSGGKPLRHNR